MWWWQSCGRETEMGDVDGRNMDDMSGYEKSGVRLAWLGVDDLVLVKPHAGSWVVPAISGMVSWLAYEILSSPSISWWFPITSPLSLSRPHLYVDLRTPSKVIPLYLYMPWSWVNTKYSIHRVLHTLSIVNTEYCIHSKIDCLPLPASLSSLWTPWCTELCTFLHWRVDQWMESQLRSHPLSDLPLSDWPLPDWPPPDWPPADRPPPDRPPPDWLPSDWLPPDWPPPSTPPIVIDHGLQVHLQTHSITAAKCISKLPRLQPWSASLSYSISASKYISKLSRLQPPSSHCHVLWSRSIIVSKCIISFPWSQPPSPSLSSQDHGVLQWWSSHGIWKEFLAKSGSRSISSIRRWWDDMNGYLAVRKHRDCMDLTMLSKSLWVTLQVGWIYESLARVHGTMSWET